MVVTYRTDTGNLRVLQRTGQLPLKMMLIGCSPENATTFTTILKRNEPLVGLTQLFPGKAVENSGNLSSCPPSNSFAFFCQPAIVVVAVAHVWLPLCFVESRSADGPLSDRLDISAAPGGGPTHLASHGQRSTTVRCLLSTNVVHLRTNVTFQACRTTCHCIQSHRGS